MSNTLTDTTIVLDYQLPKTNWICLELLGTQMCVPMNGFEPGSLSFDSKLQLIDCTSLQVGKQASSQSVSVTIKRLRQEMFQNCFCGWFHFISWIKLRQATYHHQCDQIKIAKCL